MDYLPRLKDTIEQIKLAHGRQANKTLILADKISGIKSAFLSYWETDKLPYVANFLKCVNEGIPTPTLSVCGKGTQEIRFTKYLAYFLNPRCHHGLGDLLLRAIFNDHAILNGLDEDWYLDCNVHPEIWIGSIDMGHGETNCYCDIGIVGEKYAIFLEQKILSSESSNLKTNLSQLERYSLALKHNPRFSKLKIIKIYLTPTGKLPSGVQDWVSLTHNQIIRKGIGLLKNSHISKVAKGNLQRFLIDLATGPYKESEDYINELTDLARKIVQEGFRLDYYLRFKNSIRDNEDFINIVLEGR